MLYYDKIDLSKRIDVAKNNNGFHRFKFQDSVCNGCHDLMMLCLNINNIAIITLKSVDYCHVIHDISKSEAIYLLTTSVLDDCGYI